MILFGQKWLYSDKVIVFRQNGCIRAMGLHWGKVIVFGKKWLYSGIVVLFGKGGCNRAKVFVLGTIQFNSIQFFICTIHFTDKIEKIT